MKLGKVVGKDKKEKEKGTAEDEMVKIALSKQKI